MRRGTVQHEIYEGDKAAVIVDGAEAIVEVNCKAGAGALEEEIPYALVVTLEVRDGVKIPIYEEVKTRIRQKITVGAAVGVAGPGSRDYVYTSDREEYRQTASLDDD